MSGLFKNEGLCLNQESDLLLYLKLLINFTRAFFYTGLSVTFLFFSNFHSLSNSVASEILAEKLMLMYI